MDSNDLLSKVLGELDALGIQLPRGRIHLDSYGDSAELEQELLRLIKAGEKTASTSLAWAYSTVGAEIPSPGDIQLVINSHGQPEVVTQLTSVRVVPFSEVTTEHAALEGEGDKSLAYWRESHWQFFSRECERIGKIPSEQIPVVCTVFKVLDVVNRSAVRTGSR